MLRERAERKARPRSLVHQAAMEEDNHEGEEPVEVREEQETALHVACLSILFHQVILACLPLSAAWHVGKCGTMEFFLII